MPFIPDIPPVVPTYIAGCATLGGVALGLVIQQVLRRVFGKARGDADARKLAKAIFALLKMALPAGRVRKLASLVAKLLAALHADHRSDLATLAPARKRGLSELAIAYEDIELTAKEERAIQNILTEAINVPQAGVFCELALRVRSQHQA